MYLLLLCAFPLSPKRRLVFMFVVWTYLLMVCDPCLPTNFCIYGWKGGLEPSFPACAQESEAPEWWIKELLGPNKQHWRMANDSKGFVPLNTEKNTCTVLAVQVFSGWKQARKKAKIKKLLKVALYWSMSRQFAGKPRDRQAHLLAPFFHCPLSTFH